MTPSVCLNYEIHLFCHNTLVLQTDDRQHVLTIALHLPRNYNIQLNTGRLLTGGHASRYNTQDSSFSPRNKQPVVDESP